MDIDLKHARMAGSYGALLEILCKDVEKFLNAESEVQRAMARVNLKLSVEQARDSLDRHEKVDS